MKILLYALILVIVAVIIILFIGYYISAPRYTGPVSDHFDGKTFYNLSNAQAKGFREVLGWMLHRERTQPWAEFNDTSPGPKPPERVVDSTDHPVRVTFINHSTVLLQFDSLNVLTDPVYYNRVSPFQWAGPKRNRPPGILFDDLPKINLLLLSHNHWDHLDIETVKRINQRDQPTIICPLGVKVFLEQHGCQHVVEMDWRQSTPFNSQTTIHCVPAQHFSGRGMFDRNATLWCGYVIDNQKTGNIYFAGDTGYGLFLKTEVGNKFGPLRLALIPIGAYKPTWFMSPIHCSPAEAVQIHQDVRSQQSIAIHFGTFPLADDGEQEPVDDLKKALANKGLTAESFQALTEGKGSVF